MQITILKTHQSNGAWANAGCKMTVSETRAKELIRAGIATPTVDAPKAAEEPVESSESLDDTEFLELKSAPAPSNKAAPTPKNK